MSDPYEAVIEHYGRLEFAHILEIGRPLDDFHYIEPLSDLGASFPEAYDNRMINFSLINETGNIPSVMKWEGTSGIFYQTDPSSGYWGSQRVDWDADDAFSSEYDGILERSIARIEENPELYDLRVMGSWGHAERVQWERGISEIVSEEMAQVPGLDSYRSTAIPGYPETSLRAQFINAVSGDIENGTRSVEFDCEAMSVVEGSILQRLDQHFLPRRTIEAMQEGDLKMQHNYFYATGQVSFNPNDDTAGGHAFIVSSATGNVIEATNEPNVHFFSPYIESADPEWNFDRFVRGEVFEGSNLYVYGGDLESYLTERLTENSGPNNNSFESSPPVIEF